MSFILDALKKSERQRPPGQVPDLFTVHGPQPPPPRRPTRAIVAGALLLAVPAIALWVWIGTDRRDEGADRPPAAASVQRQAEAPAAPAPSQTAAPSLPLRPARAAVGVGRKAAAERSPTAASPAQRSRAAASPGGAPTSPLPAASTPAPPPVPASASIEPSPAHSLFAPVLGLPEPAAISPPAQKGVGIPPAPTTSAPSSSEMALLDVPAPPPVTAAEPLPEDLPAEPAPPPDGRVLDLEELPAPIRAELPKLLVSGHVWSEEPSMRLLSVDDQLLREGGEAAPGVNLQEITPEGAVFVYKGWRFRVGGGRP